jgi:hypothetical protein
MALGQQCQEIILKIGFAHKSNAFKGGLQLPILIFMAFIAGDIQDGYPRCVKVPAMAPAGPEHGLQLHGPVLAEDHRDYRIVLTLIGGYPV